MSNCRKQVITETLTENYMPYAMSVIVSRAIPEIDGFKPAHRKLLYTMYKMGLLTGAKTKSANIVGQTMKLNPHGDQAIYETMVRLATGNETLLTPFVESKGNFGKVYSRDMAYAASRYTEAKLTPICSELFTEIDHNAVDMVDNYDGTMREPALFPTSFPNILVSANTGIAVGMASSFCGFNLEEVCNATLAYLKSKKVDLITLMPGPDFSTGGTVISTKDAIESVYQTGQGSIRVKGKWHYVKKGNLVEITEIPYSTTIEAIIDKIVDSIKAGKLDGISDVRDESDINGMRITVDIKKGFSYEKVMAEIEKQTPLIDNFSCNFNMLINGRPKVLGISEIINEWILWRIDTKRRVALYDIEKKGERLHLLQGLSKILLNINKAVRIIQQTEKDSAVIAALMKGFKIDETQAQFVAEIKLRNINKEYILKKTAEIGVLEHEIAQLKELAGSETKLKNSIAMELKATVKQYGTARKTAIEYATDEIFTPAEDYSCYISISHAGYLQKTKTSKVNAAKPGDTIEFKFAVQNSQTLMFFTNHAQVYKISVSEFDLTDQGYGVFIPSAVKMGAGEELVLSTVYQENASILFLYQNGKMASITMKAYETKGNRRVLKNAYSNKVPLVAALVITEPQTLLIKTKTKTITLKSTMVHQYTTMSSQGAKCVKGEPTGMEVVPPTKKNQSKK